jgi:hypothetical protein
MATLLLEPGTTKKNRPDGKKFKKNIFITEVKIRIQQINNIFFEDI